MKSGTKELKLVCQLTRKSLIYGGQLHFDPASKPEHTNPRESGPPNKEHATAKWLRNKNRGLEHKYSI